MHIKGLPPETTKSPPKKDGHTPEIVGISPKDKIDIKEETVVDPEEFERRLLAKPSNLSSRQGANNLKMIVQGKYSQFPVVAHSATAFRIRGHEQSPDSQLGSQKKRKVTFSETTASPLPPAPSAIQVPKPNFDLPSIINSLLNSPSDLHQPLFKFEATEEAALFNWELFQSHNFDLHHLLNPQKLCVTSFGSEFKKV